MLNNYQLTLVLTNKPEIYFRKAIQKFSMYISTRAIQQMRTLCGKNSAREDNHREVDDFVRRE
jgi:hypothetical protein